ncbi:MAG: hypothetical protein E7050_06800 [Lentisphaerae bacterium]|nr:hypothetical protein [Lentisphaerota bacterium]
MKKVFTGLFAVLMISVFASESSKPVVIGKVNADLLNLRLGPGLKQPVVCKLVDKTEVRIRRVVGSWLEIEAPASMAIYVSEARIGKNGVLSGELNMRSAMDAKAPVFGTLPKGAKVKKIGDSRHGWVRIEVPAEADIRIYAAAFLVNYDPSKFDADGNVISAAPLASATEVVAEKTETPEKQEKAEDPAVVEVTAPAEKQEKTGDAPIEMQGFLTRWKYSNSEDTRFALLSEPNGLNQAFVTGDQAALSAAENKQVKISGKSAGRFGGNGAIILKADVITVL